jgi:hypothetical protein
MQPRRALAHCNSPFRFDRKIDRAAGKEGRSVASPRKFTIGDGEGNRPPELIAPTGDAGQPTRLRFPPWAARRHFRLLVERRQCDH